MKTKKSNFKTGCSLKLLVVVLLLFYTGGYAGDNPKKGIKKWGISLTYGTSYDDNILKYSEKYLNRFVNREDEGRFHINTSDDLVISYAAKISYQDKFISDLKSIFSIGLSSSAYSNNSIKTWYQYKFNWRQNISKTTSISLSYSFIPNFYVRHFYDDDWTSSIGYVPEAFTPYEFSKDDYSVWLQQYLPWKTTRVRLYFSLMKYYHNKHYTEYDSDNLLYGFRIYQTITKSIKVNAGYKFINSSAKGADDTPEGSEITRLADASYDEHIVTAGFDMTFPKIFKLKNSLTVTAHYYRRFYTTNNFLELDPLHAGRFDYVYRLYFNYKIDILTNLSATAFLNWYKRDSDSKAEENGNLISDEKDYNQYQLGIKFNYKIQF